MENLVQYATSDDMADLKKLAELRWTLRSTKTRTTILLLAMSRQIPEKKLKHVFDMFDISDYAWELFNIITLATQKKCKYSIKLLTYFLKYVQDESGKKPCDIYIDAKRLTMNIAYLLVKYAPLSLSTEIINHIIQNYYYNHELMYYVDIIIYLHVNKSNIPVEKQKQFFNDILDKYDMSNFILTSNYCNNPCVADIIFAKANLNTACRIFMMLALGQEYDYKKILNDHPRLIKYVAKHLISHSIIHNDLVIYLNELVNFQTLNIEDYEYFHYVEIMMEYSEYEPRIIKIFKKYVKLDPSVKANYYAGMGPFIEGRDDIIETYIDDVDSEFNDEYTVILNPDGIPYVLPIILHTHKVVSQNIYDKCVERGHFRLAMFIEGRWQVEPRKYENIYQLDKYKQSDYKKSEDDSCVICCNADAQLLITECRHLVCLSCKERWFLQQNTCPMCRTELSNESCFTIVS